MVNKLVEVIEGSRSSLTPKIGDRMRHVDREGDFYGYALLENFRADKMSVCLAPYVPFVGISDPDIWLSVSGGPFTSIDPTEMKFIGWEDGVFSAWGHCGPCANGSVRFMAKVAKWEYIAPEPFMEISPLRHGANCISASTRTRNHATGMSPTEQPSVTMPTSTGSRRTMKRQFSIILNPCWWYGASGIRPNSCRRMNGTDWICQCRRVCTTDNS